MRADLLVLGPEALAALANPGLVKRAQRELACGRGATLSEEPDGTLRGTFPDSALVVLRPDDPLERATCSCGAVMCRHRIGLALACTASAEATGEAAGSDALEALLALGEASLVAALGRRRFTAARAALAARWPVEVDRSRATVHFETCTVRFHSADLGRARCDCADPRCAHVVLAVWALQAGDGRHELGRPAEPAAEIAPAGLLDVLDDLLEAVLVRGLAGSGPLAQRLAAARRSARAEGWAWAIDVLDDLTRQIDAYAARSAQHDATRAARLLAELGARTRATRGGADVREVMGRGEVASARLDKVRLVGLGTRLETGAAGPRAEVYLADPAAGLVLTLRHRWTDGDGVAAADRRVAPGVSLGVLAAGQVVSRGAARAANREVTLRGGRSTSVLPGAADPGDLPASLRYTGVAEALARRERRSPRWLAPRLLARDLVALPVAEVGGLRWVGGSQTLRATARDRGGQAFEVRVRHRTIAPHAVDAAALALPSAELVVGFLGVDDVPYLEPTTLFCGSIIVPDLAGTCPRQALPVDRGSRSASNVRAALGRAESALVRAAHEGLARYAPPAEGVAALKAAGLNRIAGRLDAFFAACRAAGEGGQRSEAARAWATAALWVGLALERAGGLH